MFGIQEIPLLSHAMIAAVQALVDGHVALGSGQVNPEKFTIVYATNGERGISEALESRFRL